MGICNAVLFVFLVFLYEETKYIPTSISLSSERYQSKTITKVDVDGISSTHHEFEDTIPMSPWTKRLSLITLTSEPIWPYFYRPFVVLLTFPAVLFSGIQYASGLVWLTMMSTVLSLVLPLPPYNFNPQQIGLMSIGPLIGNTVGAIYGGFLGDRSVLFYARRNRGYYEPEMRLYNLHLPAILMCAGLIMFGTTLSQVCCFISSLEW